ncbi:uncharacterized protein LOC114735671 [Neltuma alba]|uniref:uncharacterized protein LOC114735671 n=1 Tax=Neltuma alba TaxID=207710 RepID=UPI0010A4DCC1|nr:uncharacterized protein LOC114735671 [Prosopis alba]
MTTGLNLRLHPLLLISIIFLILSPTFFSPSHAEEDDDETIIAWKRERNQFNASNNNSTFMLAAGRTRRIDPANHFQYYEGGWNIIDSHYYALFAAVAAAARTIEEAVVVILEQFIGDLSSALVGGAMLYTGQGNFKKATDAVIDNVGRKISDVLDLLNGVLNNLDGAMKLAVGAYSLPGEYERNIEQFRELVHSNSSSNPRVILQNFISQADKFLSALSYVLIVVTAVMLFLAFIGFIFSVCGWRGIVYFLFFIGWIFVTKTLILSAISLVVKNGVGDTCVAIEEWLEHPQDRTSLSEVIPCVDGPTAQKALDITRNTSFQMVNMVDDFVKNIANIDPPPGAPPSASYNQSGPTLPLLCNPFNSDMTQRSCGPEEVPLDNASQVYESFVCNTSQDVGAAVWED